MKLQNIRSYFNSPINIDHIDVDNVPLRLLKREIMNEIQVILGLLLSYESSHVDIYRSYCKIMDLFMEMYTTRSDTGSNLDLYTEYDMDTTSFGPELTLSDLMSDQDNDQVHLLRTIRECIENIERNDPIEYCGVCYESPLKTESCQLSCEHNYCNGCFDLWKNTCHQRNKDMTCPECRSIVSSITKYRFAVQNM